MSERAVGSGISRAQRAATTSLAPNVMSPAPSQLPYLAPLTPLTFLDRAAQSFGGRTAFADGERRYDFREVRDRAHRLASALVSSGLDPGDRVAILAPNGLPLLESHFAVPLAGGVLVPINARLAPQEIAAIVDHSEARVLFVDSELATQAELTLARCRSLKTVLAIGANATLSENGARDYEGLLASGQSNQSLPALLDENQPISINYTSGTTGRPKGVVCTHRGAYLNAINVAFELQMSPASVYLWTLPMFHCNGWSLTWGAVSAGARQLNLRKFDGAKVWECIVSEGVTHLCAAPTVLIDLAHSPSAKRVPPERSVRVATGGAPPSPTTIGQMAALGVEVIHLYGMTETYGPSLSCAWWPEWSSLPEDTHARIKARQGVPHNGLVGSRVVDADMVDVPADGQTIGELVLKGNTIFAGYYRDEVATDEAFRGGWFHTGDLGVMHSDGYVELRDRAKDVIISGGENISTIEVEQVLLRHPAVLEVAVIGVPDERWGEVPKAFVTLKSGKSTEAAELIEFCKQNIARFKAPKYVEFSDLPKTSTGKIQKFLLREREWVGHERRIN